MRDHLVKWVDKSSWTLLNKLFEIDKVERKFSMLLTRKNLESLLEHYQAFVILVFPRLAPPTFVPSEHFVLKDLPFYEVVKLTDAKAR